MALICYIWENKITSYRQIYDRFFYQSSKPVCSRRLAKLFKAGLINKVPISNLGMAQHGYSITPKGFESCVKISSLSGTIGQAKSDSIEHDLRLVDIRERLEVSREVTRYYTENALQGLYGLRHSDEYSPFVELRSDGLAKLTLGNKKFSVPIEYEASLKSIERCSYKILAYHTRKGIDGVFFICLNETIMNRFEEIERQLAKQYGPVLHFALLRDVLDKSKDVHFRNVNGQSVILSGRNLTNQRVLTNC